MLFVGDHIYGDMLRSRKSSNWRTAMVLQELEHEITVYDRLRPDLARLDRLDAELDPPRLRAERAPGGVAIAAEARQRGPEAQRRRRATTSPPPSERSRSRSRSCAASCARPPTQHRIVEAGIDDAFNPHWGPIFREGYEVSKFGEQVEAYACVYTSRVSNFRFYSPMQYFRGPRDRMPHER